MMAHQVSQERAEETARSLARAWTGVVFHVIKDIVSSQHPGLMTHYVQREDWVSGEMIVGTRVSSWMKGGES